MMDVDLPFVTVQIDHPCLPKKIHRALALHEHIKASVRSTRS
jgi:hypothetical protein